MFRLLNSRFNLVVCVCLTGRFLAAQDVSVEVKVQKLCDDANGHFEVNRYQEALDLYKEALKAGGGELEGDDVFIMAQCQFRVGEYEKAQKNFSNLTKAYSNDHKSWNWLARCHRQSKDLPQAIRCLLAAEKIAAAEKAEDRPGYCLDLRADYTEYGDALLHQEQYKKALACSFEAEKWHWQYAPHEGLYIDVIRLRGVANLVLGNLKEAEPDIRNVLKLLPEEKFGHFWFIELLARQAKSDEFVAACETAHKLFPDDDHFWERLGTAYLFSGRGEEYIVVGVEFLGTAIRSQEKSGKKVAAKVYGTFGYGLHLLGDMEQAIVYLDKAIAGGDVRMTHKVKAYALFEMNKDDEALTEAIAGLKVDVRDHPARVLVADCLALKGYYGQAFMHLNWLLCQSDLTAKQRHVAEDMWRNIQQKAGNCVGRVSPAYR